MLQELYRSPQQSLAGFQPDTVGNLKVANVDKESPQEKAQELSLKDRLNETGIKEPIELIQNRAKEELDQAYNTLKEVIAEHQDQEDGEDGKNKNNNHPVLKARRIIAMAEYIFEQSPSLGEYVQRSGREYFSLCVWARDYSEYKENIVVSADGIRIMKLNGPMRVPSLDNLQSSYDYQFTLSRVDTPLCIKMSDFTVHDVYAELLDVIGFGLNKKDYKKLIKSDNKSPKKRWNPFKK